MAGDKAIIWQIFWPYFHLYPCLATVIAPVIYQRVEMLPSERHIFLATFLLCVSSIPIDCLRILVISPGWSNSHIMFGHRLSKTLRRHGHDVTILIPLIQSGNSSAGNPPHGVEEIRFPLHTSPAAQAALDVFQDLAFQKPTLSYFFFVTVVFREFALSTLDQLTSDHELIDKLTSRNFDLTLTHPFDLWPAGLSHRLGIKKFVYVAPGPFLLDHNYWTMALPYNPATIPNVMTKSSDIMDFGERVTNTIFWLVALIVTSIDHLFPRTESTIYRQPPHDTQADSNLWELAGRAKGIFFNGEPVLDFARPMLSTTFYLGDLDHKKLSPLTAEWQKVVDESKEGIILFSFGTIANTSQMPITLKEAFLQAFSKFPDHTILWRLEGEMPRGLQEQKHIRIVKWMPQRDLLFNPKMRLFITHGGYNSLLESTQAGVPLLFVPLFADQYANAKRASQHGIGLSLDKFSATADQIETSIRTILTNQSFKANSMSLSSELKDHIMDNEVVAMRQIERVASGNRLWPTRNVARRLNWIQYTCLDVIAFLLVLVSIMATCVLSFACAVWRLIQKQKKARKG